MTHSFGTKDRFSRREALACASAAAMFSISPGGARADPVPLHEAVAQRVRDLTSGPDVALRLLSPSGSGGNVNPVIAAFRQMTGVNVVLRETPVDEINTVLFLDVLSNMGNYDLALPATFGLPDLVAANAILPLTDLAAKHEPDGFRQGILFDIGDRFDGEIYGFQTDGDAYVMFYNKAMLENPEEQARFEDTHGHLLRVPQTWDELDRQMRFFHRPEQEQWGGILFRTPGYLAWEWWIRFHAKGVWPFSPVMEPQIASQAGVEALEEMIAATKSLHPEVGHLGLFENWERYSQGNTYCNIGWGGSQKYLNSATSKMRGNMVYGPTPGGVVDGELLLTPYFNWGWSYVVTKTTKLPEIAYLFALFASSPQMSTMAVRQKDGFFDPFRPEHYADKGIKEAYTEDFLNVHRSSLAAAIPDLYLKDQSAYFRVLGEWLGRALTGDVPPAAALDRVAQSWRLITNSSGRTLQSERWKRLRAKYPAQIRIVLRDIA